MTDSTFLLLDAPAGIWQITTYLYIFSSPFKKQFLQRNHLGCDSALEVGGKGKWNRFLTPRGIIKCDGYKTYIDATAMFFKKKFLITKNLPGLKEENVNNPGDRLG